MCHAWIATHQPQKNIFVVSKGPYVHQFISKETFSPMTSLVSSCARRHKFATDLLLQKSANNTCYTTSNSSGKFWVFLPHSECLCGTVHRCSPFSTVPPRPRSSSTSLAFLTTKGSAELFDRFLPQRISIIYFYYYSQFCTLRKTYIELFGFFEGFSREI